MKSGEKVPAFPYQKIWEEFAPDERIGWEDLELKAKEYKRKFWITELPGLGAGPFDEHDIARLIAGCLGRPASPLLSRRLHLLACWQIVGEYRGNQRLDVKGQRAALKRLQVAGLEFSQAWDDLSGHVRSALHRIQQYQCPPSVRSDDELIMLQFGMRVRDISLAAARVLEDTRPKKTGRHSAMRRDNTLRLAVEAIETEVGHPIGMSRGNNVNPAPHFTNVGGILLRDFFKLLEPRTDERILVQAVGRIKRKERSAKKLPGSS